MLVDDHGLILGTVALEQLTKTLNILGQVASR